VHFKRTNRGNYRLRKGAEEVLGLQKSEIKAFESELSAKMKDLQEEILNGKS
jgi:hypothetical protein